MTKKKQETSKKKEDKVPLRRSPRTPTPATPATAPPEDDNVGVPVRVLFLVTETMTRERIVRGIRKDHTRVVNEEYKRHHDKIREVFIQQQTEMEFHRTQVRDLVERQKKIPTVKKKEARPAAKQEEAKEESPEPEQVKSTVAAMNQPDVVTSNERSHTAEDYLATLEELTEHHMTRTSEYFNEYVTIDQNLYEFLINENRAALQPSQQEQQQQPQQQRQQQQDDEEEEEDDKKMSPTELANHEKDSENK
jgi:hypothetical protein